MTWKGLTNYRKSHQQISRFAARHGAKPERIAPLEETREEHSLGLTDPSSPVKVGDMHFGMPCICVCIFLVYKFSCVFRSHCVLPRKSPFQMLIIGTLFSSFFQTKECKRNLKKHKEHRKLVTPFVRLQTTNVETWLTWSQVVEYVAKSCPHCQSMEPIWNDLKAATASKKNILWEQKVHWIDLNCFVFTMLTN